MPGNEANRSAAALLTLSCGDFRGKQRGQLCYHTLPFQQSQCKSLMQAAHPQLRRLPGQTGRLTKKRSTARPLLLTLSCIGFGGKQGGQQRLHALAVLRQRHVSAVQLQGVQLH